MLWPFTLFKPIHIQPLSITVGILIFFTLLFWIWDLFGPFHFLKSLKQRTTSWWTILIGFLVTVGIHPLVPFFVFALVSFMSFRELISHLKFNLKVRRTIFWAYLAIPIQYYLAYYGNFTLFSLFIPISMLFILPLRTIIEDVAEDSIKTFSQLHWALMLTVYSISHICFLISLPNVPGNMADFPGMIFYLIFLTEINDVFQFLSGKLLGKVKINPNISPNKTLAGLIGGIIGTTALGSYFHFLVPMDIYQSAICAFLLSIIGFFGDLNMSAIKRDLNIKDMGDSIPGHGGVLDRLDSLTFNSLAFFYMIYFWIYA